MPIEGPAARSHGTAVPRNGSLEDFAVQVGFTSTDAVISVRGELDAHTAPTLHSVIRGLIELGHRHLVIDLAAVTFLGAGGLGVLASGRSVLRSADGSLTLRSPGRQARRILDVTGISQRVPIEDADAPVGLRADLALVAWAPTHNDVTDAKLLGVVALASDAIEGADGVSVSLGRHGRLTTVAASDQTVLRMDDHQYDTGEGPCVSAATAGADFGIDSLADEARWPTFVPRAVADGIASILSTPIVANGKPVGALNMYSSTANAFGAQQRGLASAFATFAAELIAGSDFGVTDEEVDVRISEALRSRAVLSLAQGVLMSRHRLTVDEAAAVLHRTARGLGVTTLAQAADVVASTFDPSALPSTIGD